MRNPEQHRPLAYIHVGEQPAVMKDEVDLVPLPQGK
jgi:hypothetical protein